MKSKLLNTLCAVIAFTCNATFSNAQCSNVTNGGTIGSDQSGCGSYDPANIVNVTLPTGGTGTLEYFWQSSPNTSTWSTIAGATLLSYDPPTINATTYYRRFSRRSGCSVFNGVSNTVIKTVNSPLTTTITNMGIQFCQASTVLLQVQSGATFSYQWYEGTHAIPNATSSFIETGHDGTYSCTTTNACGSYPSSPVVVQNYQSSGFPEFGRIGSFAATICPGGTVFMYEQMSYQNGFAFFPGYQWYLNGSVIPGATNYTYNATQAGDYTLQITSFDNCQFNFFTYFTNWITLTLSNNSPPLVSISANGPLTFCNGNNVLLTAATSGGNITYEWRMDINPIAGATNATFTASVAGNFNCRVTNACGSAVSNILTTTVVPTFASVFPSGPVTICQGNTQILTSSSAGGGTYQWAKNGSSINGATQQTYVVNQSGNYTVTISNSCGVFLSNSVTVNIVSFPSPTITAGGPTTFCQGGSVTLNATTGPGQTYQWRLNTFTISGATLSSYNVTSAGSYSCFITNSCGSTLSNSIVVTINTNPTATISAAGATTFCSPGSVTLNANTGVGLTYQWKNNGSTINGATASSYVASAQGSYTCAVTNSCGTVTSNAIAVTVNTIPSASISANGPTNFCTGSSVLLSANTGNGLSYQWSLDGNNIALATASTYTAATGGSYACIVSNVCGSTTSNSIAVTVSALPLTPGAISGSSTVCLNSFANQYSISTVSGATSYAWTVPTGATISQGQGTTSIFVDFGGSVSGSVCVAAVNGCGNSSTSCMAITTTSVPQIPNAISGSSSACANTANNVYSISGVIGATSYTWTLPTGASFVSGQGTSSITVSFGASGATGNICVYAGNACGTNFTCKQVTAVTGTTTPSSITGTTTPCANSNGVAYSCPAVTGASGYVWTVPAGGTIASGQGTTNITVNFNASFTSGIVGVSSVNCAGTSTARILQVYGTPAMPGSITGVTTACGGTTNVQFSIAAVPGATGYTWTAPSNASIASGQGTTTIRVNFGNGFSSGSLSVRALNSCGNSGARALAITSVPPVPGAISGPATFCANSNVNYSIAAVNGATTYNWDVPTGASITAGQGTTAITVHHGTHSGKIKVRAGNSCGYSSYQILNVTKTCRESGEAIVDNSGFEINVFPNPSSNQFTISIKDSPSEKFNFILRDLTGRIVEMRENNLSNQQLQFGSDLLNGIYIAEIIIGDKRQWIRIIKQQ